MRVRYTPRALSDLRRITEYIADFNPAGARNVKHAMDRTIELIAQFPQVGRRVGEQNTRVLPVGRYPYLIYWTVEADEARIVHIRHAARRPWRGE
jgi:plasmid stabilization system protein ParE